VGLPSQRAFLDEAPCPLIAGSPHLFLGPSGATLELRCKNKQWSLLVDDVMVEEYTSAKRSSGDETLRELRSKPEGSYMIQTDIDATQFDLNIVRKFRFNANSVPHEVMIAHREFIWQVIVDNRVVDRVSHKQADDDGEACFTIKIDDTLSLPANVNMTWDNNRCLWIYVLSVNGIEVPTCWSKARGILALPSRPPEVCTTYAEVEALADVPAPQGTQAAYYEMPEHLPQGVSFDTSTGSYQANIKSKVGRFVFLGEFATAEEAHQRYLEAVPKYYPERG